MLLLLSYCSMSLLLLTLHGVSALGVVHHVLGLVVGLLPSCAAAACASFACTSI